MSELSQFLPPKRKKLVEATLATGASVWPYLGDRAFYDVDDSVVYPYEFMSSFIMDRGGYTFPMDNKEIFSATETEWAGGGTAVDNDSDNSKFICPDGRYVFFPQIDANNLYIVVFDHQDITAPVVALTQEVGTDVTWTGSYGAWVNLIYDDGTYWYMTITSWDSTNSSYSSIALKVTKADPTIITASAATYSHTTGAALGTNDKESFQAQFIRMDGSDVLFGALYNDTSASWDLDAVRLVLSTLVLSSTDHVNLSTLVSTQRAWIFPSSVSEEVLVIGMNSGAAVGSRLKAYSVILDGSDLISSTALTIDSTTDSAILASPSDRSYGCLQNSANLDEFLLFTEQTAAATYALTATTYSGVGGSFTAIEQKTGITKPTNRYSWKDHGYVAALQLDDQLVIYAQEGEYHEIVDPWGGTMTVTQDLTSFYGASSHTQFKFHCVIAKGYNGSINKWDVLWVGTPNTASADLYTYYFHKKAYNWSQDVVDPVITFPIGSADPGTGLTMGDNITVVLDDQENVADGSTGQTKTVALGPLRFEKFVFSRRFKHYPQMWRHDYSDYVLIGTSNPAWMRPPLFTKMIVQNQGYGTTGIITEVDNVNGKIHNTTQNTYSLVEHWGP